jgi:rhodanese-related sulfurtransferase
MADNPQSASLRYISAEDLISLSREIEEGRFNFVDVRKAEEFAAGHINCAVNIPVDDLEGMMEDLDRGKMTIIYCKAGKRCMRAAEILGKGRFEDVVVLNGGYDAYRERR